MSSSLEKKLKCFREEIDEVDSLLIRTLGQRMKVSRKVGELKSRFHLPSFQRTRWFEVLETRVKMGSKVGLTPRFTKGIYRMIHGESLTIQRQAKHVRKMGIK